MSTVSLLAAPVPVDRTKAPTPGPPPKTSFPDYHEVTLKNGLKVFIVENHRQPTINFRLIIKSGDSADGKKSGIADATASLLNKGTRTHTAEQFAQETDFLGAAVEAGSSADATSVSAAGLMKFFPKILNLFVEAALHPEFPEAELEKYKRQTISNLIQAKQQPGTLGSRLRGKLLYGADHPYGAYLTEEKVAALTRDDIVKFYQTHFLPNQATLAIVGDFNAKDIIPQVEKAFADWKPAEVPATAWPVSPKLPRFSIHLIDRPGSVQSNILVTARGVARNNPDIPELFVMNAVLGGGYSGRLFQNLRERHGYTYGSGSSFYTNRKCGIFSANAEVRNEVTVPAIQEILNECKRITVEPIPLPELKRQRDYLAGNFLLSLESPARMAERVQEIDLYGLAPDFYKNYVARLNNVTPKVAQQLAEKHLPSDKNQEGIVVVVVGEAKEIKPELEKLGPVTVYNRDLEPLQ